MRNAAIFLLSRRLGISKEEAKALIMSALTSEYPEEELIDLFGPENIEVVANLMSDKKENPEEIPKKHVIIDIDLKIDSVCQKKIERNTTDTYDEYIMQALPAAEGVPLIPTSRISKEYMHIFSEYKNFNKVQSAVFKSVYETEDNVLVCAPTGAGKTDIALLAIVKHLEQQHRESKTKIIYIAPMKALAGEITKKLKRKLLVRVNEHTGDTELTKKEIEESTVLVCTPEKFDISTRKIASQVTATIGLIILDEVHILNDSRGPVIESIVCRAQMISRRLQRKIRILGISATLPNAQDVAEFLRVSREHLHIFSTAYRPVPIRYSVIGTRKAVDINMGDYVKRLDTKEKMVYVLKEKVEKIVKNDQQVLIFVHTRKDTLEIAQKLTDAIDIQTYFNNDNDNSNDVAENSNILESLQEIYKAGIFVHHAGLTREVREFAETEFQRKRIKVLVSTCTLAWGVNLPARAVIIFGTSFYCPDTGKREDLTVLDVQQMFGRAGRPQYDTEAEGILITDHKSLPKYVKMLRAEEPIESVLLQVLPMRMCAEIYLRHITDEKSALEWLKSTFMWVRMKKVPEKYGSVYNEKENAVEDYVFMTFAKLQKLELLNKNNRVTDLGRIVSHFSISEYTLCAWNELIEKGCTDTITYFVSSSEFIAFPVRENDRKALGIRDNEIDLDQELKIKKLLEKHIQRRQIKDMLRSDMKLILDNTTRLLQALFDYLQYKKEYDFACKCLFLWSKIKMQSKRYKILDINITLSRRSNAIKTDVSFTGTIYVREKGSVKSITSVYSKREYLFNIKNTLVDIQPIDSHRILNGRIEILPVAQFAENELWLIDINAEKIAGFSLKYLPASEAAEKISAPDEVENTIAFKKPEIINVETLPNVSEDELKHLMLFYLYEDLVKAMEKEKRKTVVVVPYKENEEKCCNFLKMYSMIDGVSFKSGKVSLLSTENIVEQSKQKGNKWMVSVCEIKNLYKVANEQRYFFCGFSKNGVLYKDNVIKQLKKAKSIKIYERPQEAGYIMQQNK